MDVGRRLWSSRDTAWAGFELGLYRLHERTVAGQSFQNSTMVALCVAGRADMSEAVGARRERAVSEPGAMVLSGFGLEYRGFEWTGTTDVLMLDLDMKQLGDFAGVSSERAPAHRFLIHDPRIASLMLCMAAEAGGGCESGAIYAQSLSTALAAYIGSRYGTGVAQHSAKGRLSAAQEAAVRDYVEAHLPEDISLRDLAALACLSPSHFATLFRRSFECAPHQYVMRRRVAEAARLLAERKLPISEITQLTGFADQSHLTTVFRKVTRTTPGRYQRTSGE